MYGGFWSNLKDAFKNSNNSLYKLMALNILLFLILALFRIVLTYTGSKDTYEMLKSFVMMPADPMVLLTQPWSILSYMFLHEGLFHILFNMLFLYWFGLLVNEYLGSRKLANIYILGGIAGALLYVLMYNISPYFAEVRPIARMLGASAGVYAVVVAAATIAPNTTFHLLLLGPVKIKYIAAFYVLLAFLNSAGNNAGGELAHLGGAAMGFIYITQLGKGRDLGKGIQTVGYFFENLFSNSAKVKVSYRRKNTAPDTGNYTKSRNSGQSSSRVNDTTQEEIDLILDKIAAKGYDSLSKDEKRKLFEFSKK
jgi:membrane associated rhomboid family serine protease